MNTNTNNNAKEDMSFLEEESAGGMQFKDILFLFLRNIHWFILCALIGGGLAYYKVKGQEKIYSSSTSILLKSGNSGGSESFRSSALMYHRRRHRHRSRPGRIWYKVPEELKTIFSFY